MAAADGRNQKRSSNLGFRNHPEKLYQLSTTLEVFIPSELFDVSREDGESAVGWRRREDLGLVWSEVYFRFHFFSSSFQSNVHSSNRCHVVSGGSHR